MDREPKSPRSETDGKAGRPVPAGGPAARKRPPETKGASREQPHPFPAETQAALAHGKPSEARDATRRKRTDETIQQQLRFLQTLVETIPSPLFYRDTRGRYLGCNQAYERMAGKTRDRIIGRKVQHAWCDAFCALCRAKDAELLANPGTQDYEHAVRLPDGRCRNMIIHKATFTDAGGRVAGIIGVMTDITDRKEAEARLRQREAQLRALAAEAAMAEQRERRRIAIRLHDNLAQTLARAKLEAETLRDTEPTAARAAALDGVRRLLGQAVEEARAAILDLCPPALHELGLGPAIEDLLERVRAEHGIRAAFECAALSIPLSDDLRAALYGAVMELVQNAVKHARARRLKVRLARADDKVRITVEDDGAGFDPEAVHRRGNLKGGFGLFGIAERMRYLGGSAAIWSQPGRGTRITLEAPLALEDAAR
jgi:PAS domain S-box-containing protein